MGSTRTTPYGLGFGGIGMTPVIKALLIANIAVFVITSFRLPVDLNLLLGLTPILLVKGMIWQLGTYLFLHANLGHILFNMLALWMFGTVLERTWGSRRFLKFYLVCGVGAGACVVLASFLFGDPRTTTIGASGAIYGLLVAFGVMFPNATILAFLFFPMPAKYFVILMGGISFYMAVTSGGGSTVSHIAHLGGFVVGYLYMKQMEYRPSPAYSSGRFYGHSRGGQSWMRWFSVDEWRSQYADWQRRRRRKQFEVYMRKQNERSSNDPDRWVN